MKSNCSSDSCQCSDGFSDNGTDCEPMTEKQAATTQALTQAQATTVISSLEGLSSSLWSVIAQVDRIFENSTKNSM